MSTAKAVLFETFKFDDVNSFSHRHNGSTNDYNYIGNQQGLALTSATQYGITDVNMTFVDSIEYIIRYESTVVGTANTNKLINIFGLELTRTADGTVAFNGIDTGKTLEGSGVLQAIFKKLPGGSHLLYAFINGERVINSKVVKYRARNNLLVGNTSRVDVMPDMITGLIIRSDKPTYLDSSAVNFDDDIILTYDTKFVHDGDIHVGDPMNVDSSVKTAADAGDIQIAASGNIYITAKSATMASVEVGGVKHGMGQTVTHLPKIEVDGAQTIKVVV